MKKRKLGELEVSAVGMGCMGFTHGYGDPPPEDISLKLMRLAYEKGCRLFDTAQIYSYGLNEEFVGKAVKDFRHDIILTTKFSPSFLPNEEPMPEGKLSGKAIRRALENSLRRLQTDYLDLYLEHRVPLESDVEEVAGIMGDLIKEGKIRAWGQSESTPEQIRRAHAVTPMAAVQSEYSIMERRYEKEVIPLCEKLGIGFEAYSPMAGGFLSGKIAPGDTFKGDDVRRVITRYYPENMAANQGLLDMIRNFAAEKGVTPAQISLAYLMKFSPCVVPIPGMRSEERIAENLGAAAVELSDGEFAALQSALDKIEIFGDRKDSDIGKLGTIKIFKGGERTHEV